MTMLNLDEIEELFPEEILYFPWTQRLIVDCKELPDDFEERVPTLTGISPVQMEITQRSIDEYVEYLEPEIEIIYEFEADYEEIEEVNSLIVYKNKYERYIALIAAFVATFFLIGGINSLATSFNSLHKFKKQVEKKELNIMAQNPQKDVLLKHSQPRANDWKETSPKLKIRFDMDTFVELEGVTSEHHTYELLEPTFEYLFQSISLVA